MNDSHLREELEALRRELDGLARERRGHRRSRRAALAAAVLVVAGVALAQPVITPFIANQPAVATQVNGNFTQLAAFSVPPGAVMAFDLATCPEGWALFTEGQGRALVGRPTNGTLKRTFGGAFNADNETQHSHGGVTGSAGDHQHGGVTNGWIGWISGTVNYNVDVGRGTIYHIQESITTDVRGAHAHGLGGSAGSSVIPYVYLTVCKKSAS